MYRLALMHFMHTVKTDEFTLFRESQKTTTFLAIFICLIKKGNCVVILSFYE